MTDFQPDSPLRVRLNWVVLLLAGVGGGQGVGRDGGLIRVTSWEQAAPALQNNEEQEDPTPEI